MVNASKFDMSEQSDPTKLIITRGKMPEPQRMLVEKKPTDRCDREFCFNSVRILTHEGVFASVFPPANRLVSQVTPSNDTRTDAPAHSQARTHTLERAHVAQEASVMIGHVQTMEELAKICRSKQGR